MKEVAGLVTGRDKKHWTNKKTKQERHNSAECICGIPFWLVI
jgi:hypothetical protein